MYRVAYTFILVSTVAVVVMLSGCSGSSGKAPASEPASPAAHALELEKRGALLNASKLQMMAQELYLTAAETEQLRAAFDRRDKAVGAWLSGNKGKKLMALEADMQTAAQSRDLQGVKSATRQAAPLRRELETMVSEHENRILRSLSQDKQTEWIAILNCEKLINRLEDVGVSGQQRHQLREAARGAIDQAAYQGLGDPARAGFLILEDNAKRFILTPQQVKAYGAWVKAHPFSMM